jgi:hypothetical protein
MIERVAAGDALGDIGRRRGLEQGLPGLRPDHAVRGQAEGALAGAHGLLGAATEQPVGHHLGPVVPEYRLQLAHLALAFGRGMGKSVVKTQERFRHGALSLGQE